MQLLFCCTAALNTDIIFAMIYQIAEMDMRSDIIEANGAANIGEKTFNRNCLTFHLRRKIFIRPPRGPIDLS